MKIGMFKTKLDLLRPQGVRVEDCDNYELCQFRFPGSVSTRTS